MPKPSWELSNNAGFYGYLKFLDFQQNQKDLHVTFEKSQRVHISIYELGGKKQLGGSLWMAKEANGLHLVGMDWFTIAAAVGCAGTGMPTVIGYKNYEEFFTSEVNEKARELGIIPQKPGHLPVNNQRKIVASDFPSL